MHADRFALSLRRHGALAICVFVFGAPAAEASLRLTVLKTEGAYGSAICAEMPNGRNLWINGGSAVGAQAEVSLGEPRDIQFTIKTRVPEATPRVQ